MATAEELRTAFKSLRNSSDVSKLLGVKHQTLTYILYSTQVKRYEIFHVKKRRGGTRKISAPIPVLKMVQRRLVDTLHAVYEPPAPVHGFVRNRSPITNARKHVSQRWILNVDLLDFFPSINFGRVRGLFMAAPYSLPSNVATVLAQICTDNNELPQGAPTSPIIANMICARMDGRLRAIAESHKCMYTRYADDITISCSRARFPSVFAVRLPHDGVKVGRLLNDVISDNGFRINPKKVHLQNRARRQEVTGIVVNEFLNVRREYLRQTRAMLNAWRKYGEANAELEFQTKYDHKHRAPGTQPPSFRQVVLGRLRFLRDVRGASDPVVTRTLERARRADGRFAAIPIWKDAIWVLFDAAKTGRQGTAFNLEEIGLVTCWHGLADDSTLHHSDSTQISEYPILLSRGNKDLDLAILSSEAPALWSFRRSSAEIGIGTELTLLGFPGWNRGQELQVVKARVTGFQRRFGTRRIVVDIPLVSGMSGGPALDSSGRVVGVVLTGVYGAPGGERVGNHIQPISEIDTLVRLPDDACDTEFDPPVPAADPEPAIPVQGSANFVGKWAQMVWASLRRLGS